MSCINRRSGIPSRQCVAKGLATYKYVSGFGDTTLARCSGLLLTARESIVTQDTGISLEVPDKAVTFRRTRACALSRAETPVQDRSRWPRRRYPSQSESRQKRQDPADPR